MNYITGLEKFMRNSTGKNMSATHEVHPGNYHKLKIKVKSTFSPNTTICMYIELINNWGYQYNPDFKFSDIDIVNSAIEMIFFDDFMEMYGGYFVI